MEQRLENTSGKGGAMGSRSINLGMVSNAKATETSERTKN